MQPFRLAVSPGGKYLYVLERGEGVPTSEREGLHAWEFPGETECTDQLPPCGEDCGFDAIYVASRVLRLELGSGMVTHVAGSP